MSLVPFTTYIEQLSQAATQYLRPFYMDSLAAWNNVRSQLRLNVREDDDGYIYEIEVPGASKRDVNISVNNNVLTIVYNKMYGQNEINCQYMEHQYGKFTRTITLPENTDSENIKITLHNGLLKIYVKKCVIDNSRQLTIE